MFLPTREVPKLYVHTCCRYQAWEWATGQQKQQILEFTWWQLTSVVGHLINISNSKLGSETSVQLVLICTQDEVPGPAKSHFTHFLTPSLWERLFDSN
jgi:hypothetical protein